MKPLISRAFVALATALSLTLAGFAAYVAAWPLAFIHLFIGIVLLGAYLRPMEFDVSAEVQRRHDLAERFD